MDCNKEIDYSPIKTRAIDRIKKILSEKPEYMLVVIEKQKETEVNIKNWDLVRIAANIRIEDGNLLHHDFSLKDLLNILDSRYKLKNET